MLQRKVWFRFQGTKVFCNLYTILIGGPAAGKTTGINAGQSIVSQIPTMQFAAQMSSKEKLIHNIAKSLRSVEGTKLFEVQCAYAAIIPEFAIFLRPNDVESVNLLLELYDCKSLRYETLSRETANIENVYFTILAGTTPDAFANNVARPYGGTGLISRFNLIYSEESKIPDIFQAGYVPDYSSLAGDLLRISRICGEASFEPSARKFIQDLVDAGIPPTPTDSRLAEYLPRRAFHWMKLCVIAAISEGETLTISRSHAELALGWLLDAERGLEGLTKFFGASPVLAAMRGIDSWLQAEVLRTGKALSEAALKRKLLEEVPPQHLNHTLVEMLAAGRIRMEKVGEARFYRP